MEAVYSYATVGAAGEGGGSDTRTDAVSIDGNRYETPTGGNSLTKASLWVFTQPCLPTY